MKFIFELPITLEVESSKDVEEVMYDIDYLVSQHPNVTSVGQSLAEEVEDHG